MTLRLLQHRSDSGERAVIAAQGDAAHFVPGFASIRALALHAIAQGISLAQAVGLAGGSALLAATQMLLAMMLLAARLPARRLVAAATALLPPPVDAGDGEATEDVDGPVGSRRFCWDVPGMSKGLESRDR